MSSKYLTRFNSLLTFLKQVSHHTFYTLQSTIADKVCNEWVDLVHNKIPPQFWLNLDSNEGKLQEEARWRSVRDFANNCVKRKAFEEAYRKQYGISGPVVVPGGGVPKDILTKLHLERTK